MLRHSLLIILSISCITASAQKRGRQKSDDADTSRPGTVVITSAYKPELKTTAKINFSAASSVVDSTRPSLTYNVPGQNLFFSYQPIPLQPLALDTDSALEWRNSNYVKLGYGNYNSPLLQAGLSVGNTDYSVSAHAKHVSSKGRLPFQQYGNTSAELIGIINNELNHEWTGKLYWDNKSHYQYGYDNKAFVYTNKDSLRRRYNNIGFTAGLRNKQVNEFGISYAPKLDVNFVSDNRSAKETNFLINAPVSKYLTRAFSLHLGLTADLTSYKTDIVSIKNNLVYIEPAVMFKTPNLSITGGFIPSWDNSEFKLLPNFSAQFKLKDQRFTANAGWIGSYQKNNYRQLYNINPFMEEPFFLANTRQNEIYAGFKGSAGNHITYSARVSFLNFHNQILFVNDTTTGKGFYTSVEPTMNSFRVHGEVGYTVQEKFWVAGGLTFNQYSGLDINEKAWHLLPVELNASLRWQVLPDLMVKSDLLFFEGPQYLNKKAAGVYEPAKLKPGIDLNAGAEFGILPRLNIWIQFNNILNNRYQRWNQYEVLGFQVLGGVSYSFGDLKHLLKK